MKRRIADLWRPVREHARKLLPSRAARWMLIYLPLFSVLVWFGIEAILPKEAAPDVKAALINAGVFSVRVMVAIGLVHAITCRQVWGWDLANTYRERLQRILDGSEQGDSFGALAVLAGETLAKVLLLWLFLRALILYPQGVG